MIRFLLRLLILATIACAGVYILVTEPDPALPAMPPPDGRDVAEVREVVHQIRAVTEGRAENREVRMQVGDIGAGMRLGARFLPGLRAESRIDQGAVAGQVAVPVPWIGGARWLNLAATIPPFEGRIAPSALSAGPVSLPPAASVEIARRLANLVLGQRAGDTILASAEAMRIEGDTLIFTLRLSAEGRGEVARGIFGALRGSDMPAPERIETAYRTIREALDAGVLPDEGSFLPHLLFALDLARQRATDETLADDYTAAIFGLARACGAVDFRLIVGRFAGTRDEDGDRWRKTCDRVTLAGRIDSKRHFITAAAIQAASNRGFSISVGEFKELHDSISGANGFDFTDITANNSGIRLSDRMMSTALADWPALLDLMQDEGAVLAGYEDIPALMSEAEFAARFGNVNSPEYAEMMARIEARIDALPIHAAAP